MAMRTECKNYESRTYASGETVRKCNIDLAPEAPWRCPENCKGFEPRMADVNWKYGTLVNPPAPPEPPNLEGAAEVLDEAEEILNAAGPQILAEMGQTRRANRSGGERLSWWQRLRRRG